MKEHELALNPIVDFKNIKRTVGFTATQLGITPAQVEQANRLIDHFKPDAVVHGGCIGGDEQLDELATKLVLPRMIFPSDNLAKSFNSEHYVQRGGAFILYPRKAPLDRNHDIVKASSLLVGCPREFNEVQRSGTWMTIRLARRLLGPERVVVIWPDGAMSMRFPEVPKL